MENILDKIEKALATEEVAKVDVNLLDYFLLLNKEIEEPFDLYSSDILLVVDGLYTDKGYTCSVSARMRGPETHLLITMALSRKGEIFFSSLNCTPEYDMEFYKEPLGSTQLKKNGEISVLNGVWINETDLDFKTLYENYAGPYREVEYEKLHEYFSQFPRREIEILKIKDSTGDYSVAFPGLSTK